MGGTMLKPVRGVLPVVVEQALAATTRELRPAA